MRQKHGDAPLRKKAAKKKSAKKRATKKVAKKAAGKKAAKKKAAKKTGKRSTKVEIEEPVGLFRPDVVNPMLELMAEKCYMQWEAAPAAGVSVKTVQRWLARGRSHRDSIEVWKSRVDERDETGESIDAIVEDMGPCPKPNQWSEFVEAYEQAEIEAKEKMMGVVRRGALMDPKLAFMWLERRYPLDWGNAATRPGIGRNAGEHDDGNSGSGDAIVELESAIASFVERARATVDPLANRA